MKTTTILIIGAGGFIGTILRYLTSLFFSKQYSGSFIPFGTLAVNLAGSLIIGIVYGLSERWQVANPQLRLFLATGICGGFTTFSSLMYEDASFIREANYGAFALYSGVSFVLGLVAVFGGLSLSKLF